MKRVYMAYPDGRKAILDALPNAVDVPGGTHAHIVNDDGSEFRAYRLMGWTSWQQKLVKRPLGMIAQVNRALKARGEQPRLRKGKGGYHYFDGPALAWRGGSSVAVARAESLGLDWWLAEYDRMKAEAQS